MSRRTWRIAPHSRVGRRGRCLLFFGALDLVYAWAMWTVPPNQQQISATYRWFGEIAPLHMWAALWAIVGALCLFDMWRTTDRLAFVAAIGIKVVWGITSVAGWALDDIPVSSGAIWLGLAGLVWTISGWSEPEDHGEDGA